MPTPAEENRRAKIVLDRQTLAMLLDLPEGLYVAGISTQFDPARIYVLIEGEALEAQPHDTEAPILEGTFSQERILVNNRAFMRWGWQR